MERLAVYVFWEKDGIVREYIVYYLQQLLNVVKDIVVVVNGDITDEGKSRLIEIGCQVCQRPNEGYDFWAYKAGLEFVGKSLKDYDEIVLCNCSCYGPIYPFSKMFEGMATRNLDFWGITDWLQGNDGHNYHIQTYFIVFKKKLIRSDAWGNWWNNLPVTKGWTDTVVMLESQFTKYFTSKGFVCDVYCKHNDAYIDMTLDASDILVSEMFCPLVKRKAFSIDYERFFAYARGSATKNMFDYVKNNNLYDVDMIIDDLLATEHYYNIKNNLHLNFFLSSTEGKKINKHLRIAVFLHVFYDDLLEKNLSYLKNVPDYADIYVTTSIPEQVDKIKGICKECDIHLTQVFLIPSRGRADSAFMVHNRERFKEYDLVCTVHDKKSTSVQPGSVGLEFAWHNMDSLLKSKEYIENIINLFITNERVGIVGPMNVIHGPFQALYLAEWGVNYSGVVKMLDKLGIHVPLSIDVPPIAPIGAMFWFRPKALSKFLKYPWKYEDFPEEPMPLDGAIIHIAERAYSFVAQDAGYLSVWAASLEDAAVHMTSLAHCVRKLNAKVNTMFLSSTTITFKSFLKRVLPPKVIMLLLRVKNLLKKK